MGARAIGAVHIGSDNGLVCSVVVVNELVASACFADGRNWSKNQHKQEDRQGKSQASQDFHEILLSPIIKGQNRMTEQLACQDH